MSTPSAARPDRYGPPPRRPGPRATLALVVAALALAAGWAAWSAWSDTDRRIGWTDIAYRVPDDATTVVTFEVNRDPGTTVVCTVRALNRSFAEVGLVDVTVPPSDSRSSRAEVEVPTSERAVSGTVKGCVTS